MADLGLSPNNLCRPGLREHFIFWPQIYSKDNFINKLGSSFRFLWPYDAHDIFNQASDTGSYKFSLEFSKRLHDLRCWTVERDLFEAHPELRSEIPTFHSRPEFLAHDEPEDTTDSAHLGSRPPSIGTPSISIPGMLESLSSVP